MVYLLTPALPPGLQPPGSTLKVAIEEGEFELGPHFHDTEDSVPEPPLWHTRGILDLGACYIGRQEQPQ